MNAFSDSELLRVWERGLNQPWTVRALLLLAAASPDSTLEDLARLPVGRRDARLLSLREMTFGLRLVSLTECPTCGEQLELNFKTEEIRADARDEKDVQPDRLLRLTVADYELLFRLPNSLDLLAVSESDNLQAARHLLFERCLLDAHHQGRKIDACDLPPFVLEAVEERMAQADPQADVQLELLCPFCSHQWQAAFDIVSFFWKEVNAGAHRLLREVHALASAYGWRESDILAMTAQRRQTYLEMISR